MNRDPEFWALAVVVLLTLTWEVLPASGRTPIWKAAPVPRRPITLQRPSVRDLLLPPLPPPRATAPGSLTAPGRPRIQQI